MDYVTNAFSWGFDKTVGLFLPGWDAPEDAKGYGISDSIIDTFVPESIQLLSNNTQPDEYSASIKNIKEKQYTKLPPNLKRELYEKAQRDGNHEKIKFYDTLRKEG